MPPTSSLLSFAVASLLLAVAPGPSAVFQLALGADRGRAPALLASLGLTTGILVWVAVTAVGLGAVIAARPGVLDGLTIAGAAYLLWLGRCAWRGSVDSPGGATVAGATADAGATDVAAVTPGRGAYAAGTVVNLLNPSLALFLAALLPPYVEPDAAPAWSQVLVLGAVLAGVSTVVNAGYGLVGAAVGGSARRAVGDRRAAAVTAATYVALAAAALVAVLR